MTFPARAARAAVSRGRFSSATAAPMPVSLQGVRAGIPNAARAKLAEAVLGKKQKALRTDKTLERVQAVIPTGLQHFQAAMCSSGTENEL